MILPEIQVKLNYIILGNDYTAKMYVKIILVKILIARINWLKCLEKLMKQILLVEAQHFNLFTLIFMGCWLSVSNYPNTKTFNYF